MPDLTRDEIAAIRADAAGPLVHIRKVVESVVPICDAYLALLDRVDALERTGRAFIKEAASDKFHAERYAIAMDEFNAALEQPDTGEEGT